MNPTIKNIAAIFAGIIIGGAVNMGIITISGSIIPPPPGVDVTTEAGLKAGIHLFEPKHFIMPFLAHALGTFIGALFAAYFVANNRMRAAMVVSLVSLAGGITAVYMIPSPTWFSATDLIAAYLPMGFIAGKIVGK